MRAKVVTDMPATLGSSPPFVEKARQLVAAHHNLQVALANEVCPAITRSIATISPPRCRHPSPPKVPLWSELQATFRKAIVKLGGSLERPLVKPVLSLSPS